jgi:hypothetical protein
VIVRAAVLAALLLVATGCGDDDDADADSPAGPGGATPYALLVAEGWTLAEAVDPPPDDPIALMDRPALDWYAEYRTADATRSVRVSGHEATLDDARAQLASLGFAFDAIDVDGWPEAVGAAGDVSGNPAVVLLAHGPGSVVVLSYDVDVDELRALAADVEPADEAAWVDAGGVVR